MRLFYRTAFAAVMALAFLGVTGATSSDAYAKKCLPGTLKSRLSQIRSKFGSVRIISTFRKGARIAGTGRPSLHASCRAVDFHPPRGKYRQVAAWLKKNHGGGVGTYSCGMRHIHLDNGPRVRFHKCVGKSGRRSARKNLRRRAAARTNSQRRAQPRASRTMGRTTARTQKPAKPQFSAQNLFTGSKTNGG